MYFERKFISILRSFVQRKTEIHLGASRNLPQKRNHGNTFIARLVYFAHPTQLRDIRDKLLASPISYLHFITGVRVICTLCRRIGNFLLPRRVTVEKVLGEQVKLRGGGGRSEWVVEDRERRRGGTQGDGRELHLGWRRDTFLLIPSRTPSSVGT